MKTLLFAGILYLVGIVVILLLRPNLMFSSDGQWREFGTISKDDTIFPFWLFCIVWAALSYCITVAFIVDPVKTGILVSSVSGTGRLHETEPPEDLIQPLPSKKKSKGASKSGYYILDAKEMKKSGIPKYIYVDKNSSEAIALEKEESDRELKLAEELQRKQDLHP